MAADQFAMELPGSIKRLQAVIGEEVSIKSIKSIKKKHPKTAVSDRGRGELEEVIDWLLQDDVAIHNKNNSKRCLLFTGRGC